MSSSLFKKYTKKKIKQVLKKRDLRKKIHMLIKEYILMANLLIEL